MVVVGSSLVAVFTQMLMHLPFSQAFMLGVERFQIASVEFP